MRLPANCCCKHPDARRCAEWRSPPGYNTDRDDLCECSCHSQDEDGRDGWDDDDYAPSDACVHGNSYPCPICTDPGM